MDRPIVKISLKDGAKMPIYSSQQAAGADICACLAEDFILESGNFAVIPTGISLELPVGYEAQIRPRSGLAAKSGITVLNSPGTVDSDYRGEVCVILINHSKVQFVIHNGDRIAQMVIAPHCTADFVPSLELNESQRGKGGFGSTGI